MTHQENHNSSGIRNQAASEPLPAAPLARLRARHRPTSPPLKQLNKMHEALKLTYRDYAALPEGGRYQLLDGDLRRSPAPSLRHQKVSGQLFLALATYVQSADLGSVWSAPVDVILADETVVQPDVVFVSRQRSGLLAPEGIRGAPDLCIEVLSRKTRTLDRDIKRKLYARHGVTEYWIADPDENTLEIFRLQTDPTQPTACFSAGQSASSQLLPGLVLDLGAIFS